MKNTPLHKLKEIQLVVFLLLLAIGIAGIFLLTKQTRDRQKTQDIRSEAAGYNPIHVMESQEPTETGKRFKLHVRVENTQAAYPSNLTLKTSAGEMLQQLALTRSENQNQCELDQSHIGTFTKYETDWFTVDGTPETEGYIAALDKGYSVELTMTDTQGRSTTHNTYVSRICSDPLPMSEEASFDMDEEPYVEESEDNL